LKAQKSDVQLRNFGLIVGATFAGLFGLIGPWIRHKPVQLWPWVLGAVLSGLALIAPKTLHYPQFIWDRVGKVLGWVNSRIVLNLIFFLVFLPAGLVARAFKWDPLERNFDKACQSYRIPSRRQSATSMEKPY
jgi:hypothetical protein